MSFRYVRDILRHLTGARETSFYAMFKAFMDESGIGNKSRACVVAGYAGSETECDRVATRWADLVGPICEFHAVEFFPRAEDGRMTGIYKNYSPSFVEGIVVDLIHLLSDSKLEPIGLALDVEAFKSLHEDERRWLTSTVVPGKTWPMQGAPNTPYFGPFLYCVNSVNDYTPDAEKVYITFDRQQDYENKARIMYNDLLAMGGKWGARLGETLAFSSRYQAVLLQAADLLAFVTGWSVTKENIRSDIANLALQKLAYGRDFMRVLDYRGIDRQLITCPFRSTIFGGEDMYKGDFLEQIRAQGINVLAIKVDDGSYRSHYIKRKKVKPIYELPDPETFNRSE